MAIGKSKFLEGAIIEIPISDDRKAYGRLFPHSHVAIYDFVLTKYESFDISKLVNVQTLFIVQILTDIVTGGWVEIVGEIALRPEEIDKMPPHFVQNEMNFRDCKIFYMNGQERKVIPAECVGLEGPTIWDIITLKRRILDHYCGKKMFSLNCTRSFYLKRIRDI